MLTICILYIDALSSYEWLVCYLLNESGKKLEREQQHEKVLLNMISL